VIDLVKRRSPRCKIRAQAGIKLGPFLDGIPHRQQVFVLVPLAAWLWYFASLSSADCSGLTIGAAGPNALAATSLAMGPPRFF
jgi:hypothetical protein